MGGLKIRDLVLKKQPKGYRYVVKLKRSSSSAWASMSNAGDVETLRGLLRTVCRDQFHLVHCLNFKGKRVYTDLYLREGMDVAMLKMSHAHLLHRIYRVVVTDSAE